MSASALRTADAQPPVHGPTPAPWQRLGPDHQRQDAKARAIPRRDVLRPELVIIHTGAGMGMAFAGQAITPAPIQVCLAPVRVSRLTRPARGIRVKHRLPVGMGSSLRQLPSRLL